MGGALQGLRLIDLTEGIAGPYATALFAGLGADVLKIERPLRGDIARRWGPFPGDDPDPEPGGLFLYLNGGKRSLTLDTGSPSGRALLSRLVASSDILFAGEEAAIDASLSAARPELIVVRVTPFGRGGPYGDFRGAEAVYQALCGLAFITGEPSREPLCVGVPLAQYAAGQLAFAAAMTALHHRLQTGEGQEVDVSILESAVTIMEHAPAVWSYRKRLRRRSGNLGGLAGWGIYPCRDGHIGVISGLGEAYETFLDWAGLSDPKFRSWSARTEYADEMHAAILGRLADRSKHELFQEAQARGIPFGYVCTVEDLARSPQLTARGFFVETEQPRAGRVRLPGPPFIMSDTPWRQGPAPALGEHNDPVLCGELGLRRDDLPRLRAAGVI